MKPEDTTKQYMHEQETSAELGIPVGGLMVPGAIEAMEAEGQRQLVASSSLPTELRGGDDAKALLVSWGFVFGEIDSEDSLFTPVQLPPGWTKAGTDHDMHSNVVDDKGRERIGVFYKAAFYDRRADMHIVSRYQDKYMELDDLPEGAKSGYQAIDAKTGETLATFTGTYAEAADGMRDFWAAHSEDNPSDPKHWDAD